MQTHVSGAPTFLRTWLTGYTDPHKLADMLAARPAPHTGIFAQLLRAALDSLLVYLPLALMHRLPPEPPYLRFIAPDRYYAALIGLAPLVLLAELLLTAVFVHVLLRLAGCASDFDRLVNLAGMSALIVGAVLVPWDWLWVMTGRVDQIFLGVSHLVIALWATVIMVVALRRLFRVPLAFAVLVNVLAMPSGWRCESCLCGPLYNPASTSRFWETTISGPLRLLAVLPHLYGLALQEAPLRRVDRGQLVRYELDLEVFRRTIHSGACDDWLAEFRAYLRGNRDVLVEFIQAELPHVRTAVPEATYLAWLD